MNNQNNQSSTPIQKMTSSSQLASNAKTSEQLESAVVSALVNSVLSKQQNNNPNLNNQQMSSNDLANSTTNINSLEKEYLIQIL